MEPPLGCLLADMSGVNQRTRWVSVHVPRAVSLVRVLTQWGATLVIKLEGWGGGRIGSPSHITRTVVVSTGVMASESDEQCLAITEHRSPASSKEIKDVVIAHKY